MNPNQPQVSVIIVTYNAGGYITPCLRSVLQSDFRDYEVIVVDNASSDKSLAEILMIKSDILHILRNPRNLGFAEGNNIGARAARGRYLVLLNQDTVVDEHWLTNLVTIAETDESVGAVSCKVLSLDNPKVFDTAGHSIDILGFPYDRGFHALDVGQYDRMEPIFAVNGAAFLVEKNLFMRLGGFDPRFFLLYDETDLCWRIWLAGRRVVFSRLSIVRHKGSISRNREFNKYFMLRNQMRSLIKNYESWRLLLFFPFFLGALGILMVIGLRYRRIGLVRSVLGAIVWNARNLGDSLRMRQLEPVRMISNGELLNRGIIKPLNLREASSRLSLALQPNEVSTNPLKA